MNRIYVMSVLLNHIAGFSTAIGGLVGFAVGLFGFGRPVAGAFVGAIGCWVCLQFALWFLDRRMLRKDAKAKNDEFDNRWQSGIASSDAHTCTSAAKKGTR